MPKAPHLFRFVRLLPALVAAAFLLPADALAQGNTIRNTATLTVSAPGGDVTIPSNPVETTVGRYKTRITFHRLPEGWNPDYSHTKCELLPRPTYRPIPLDEQLFAEADPLKSLDIDNPYVMALDAPGENHDKNAIEKTFVTASSGIHELDLELTETGPNTGVFAGMIPPSGRHSNRPDTGCDIGYDDTGMITVRFAGDEDDDGSVNSILIDPQGHVFDSVTGEALNGATVTVINDATGLPAQVFGDDGISAYPNTMVTGSTVTDSGGHVYPMFKGDYRFPLMAPGNYRLVVTPPPGYSSPSIATPASMATLRDPHGAPFTIVSGSFGGVFTLSDPFPVTIDIPVDPKSQVTQVVQPRLVLDKTASERDASAGDFIQYRLELKNAGDGAAKPATVSDLLPRGFRYRLGSTQGVAEPAVAKDGRTLTFTVPNLAAGATTRFTYIAEVGPGTPVGEAVNSATATAPGATEASNTATASVRIRAPLFTDAFTIIGRVTEGGCGDPEPRPQGHRRHPPADGRRHLGRHRQADGLYHFEGASPARMSSRSTRRAFPRAMRRWSATATRARRAAASRVSSKAAAAASSASISSSARPARSRGCRCAAGRGGRRCGRRGQSAPTGWPRRRRAPAGSSRKSITTRAPRRCASSSATLPASASR
jgi:uncharacterized repeat protein (TIGR01451 family)